MTTNAPSSQAELILLLAQQNLDFEKRLCSLTARVEDVAAQNITSSTDYFTIAGYATLLHQSLTREQAVALGKQAVRLSRQQNRHIGKVLDARYGYVGLYHRDVLASVFQE